jgi:hypothetical protein
MGNYDILYFTKRSWRMDFKVIRTRFFAAVGDSGRVYDLCYTTNGERPSKKIFIQNEDFYWSELIYLADRNEVMKTLNFEIEKMQRLLDQARAILPVSGS